MTKKCIFVYNKIYLEGSIKIPLIRSRKQWKFTISKEQD
jgi:hypothetical protein